jgi:hypothetical protein
MARITLFRNPTCAKCAKIARTHQRFDWFRRIAHSTETSPLGPLVPGQIAVRDERSGATVTGVEAVRQIVRQVPLYWAMLPLLYVPAVARKVDRETRGCADGACALPAERK